MKARRYAAVDLGAGSGRVVAGAFDGERLTLEEVHRFDNEPVEVLGTVYWNMLGLYHQALLGIRKAEAAAPLDSLGIDTWGNDFALLDSAGRMLDSPIHYRDEISAAAQPELYEIVPSDELYRITGIQHLRYNAIFRLFAMARHGHTAYRSAARFQMIPDIIACYLTGEMLNEFTNATTTQMMDCRTGDWAYDMLARLGIRPDLFQTPAAPGSVRLKLRDGILKASPPLCLVGTHDTASAVAAVPCPDDDFIYVSSGTWSLVGTETAAPLVSPEALRYNLTNEGGVLGTNRLLKNVMGLWILQELRREWRAGGADIPYSEIMAQAVGVQPFARLIDPDDDAFGSIGGMTARINAFLGRTGQPLAAEVGEFARCVFDSLALRYRSVIARIAALTGKQYRAIHIVGGGSQNALLNQTIADVCGLEVVAGPVEATAAGNMLMQAYALGDVASLKELRSISAASARLTRYAPRQSEAAGEAYAQFLDRIDGRAEGGPA